MCFTGTWVVAFQSKGDRVVLALKYRSNHVCLHYALQITVVHVVTWKSAREGRGGGKKWQGIFTKSLGGRLLPPSPSRVARNGKVPGGPDDKKQQTQHETHTTRLPN